MPALKVGDKLCDVCGGINKHEVPDCKGEPSEILSVYTRAQAFEDGILVDCSTAFYGELASRAGIRWPIAVTPAVFHRYIEVPMRKTTPQEVEDFLRRMDVNNPELAPDEVPVFPGQSKKGRYWDFVWMLRLHLKGQLRAIGYPEPEDTRLYFQFFCLTEGPCQSNERDEADGRRVTLKAVTGPGDDLEPVFTIGLPEEDLS